MYPFEELHENQIHLPILGRETEAESSSHSATDLLQELI